LSLGSISPHFVTKKDEKIHFRALIHISQKDFSNLRLDQQKRKRKMARLPDFSENSSSPSIFIFFRATLLIFTREILLDQCRSMLPHAPIPSRDYFTPTAALRLRV
jgi:hypothetical protein